MYCEKAATLIKKLNRNRDLLTTYYVDLILDILHESKHLLELNIQLAEITGDRNHPDHKKHLPTVMIRHACIKRNMRCIAAYLYSRVECLKKLRWQYGIGMASEVKQHVTNSEMTFMKDYNRMLEQFKFDVCGAVADCPQLDLMQDMKPPKSLYIQVRCLEDHNGYQLTDGTILPLKKDRIHFLPRKDCLELIRKGVLEHVV